MCVYVLCVFVLIGVHLCVFVCVLHVLISHFYDTLYHSHFVVLLPIFVFIFWHIFYIL